MATIDQRIVSMVFENDKFERNVAQSMGTLKKLNDALNHTGNAKAFDNMEKESRKVTFSGPMSALDKFRSALSGIGRGASSGMSAIGNAFNRLSMRRPVQQLGEVETKTRNVGSGASRSFGEIQNAASRLNLGHVTGALDGISHKFSIMQGAAAVALGNIASRAVTAGTQVVKSLTITPVMEGFHNYETQINAVQTILANTGLRGKAGLDQVTSTLKELNTYANRTVYNFSEMARNIGTFTAAGVQLKPATAAIKGIANLGAMSGSSATQVNTAMYQLSQALAAGKVGLQDWNSVVNAGMGGQVFQRALANTAGVMGTLGGRAVEFNKITHQLSIGGESFRQSMQAGPGKPPPWLTSGVLIKTLQQFTGDMTDAQLRSEGFTQSQVKSIQAQAKLATQSATQIKTVTQLFQALKEEVGTAWGAIFKTIFGDINQAKDLLSPLHTAIENALTNPIYALNRVLEGWSKMGGRKTLIDALHQGVKDLGMVLKPVVQAFHDIFPPTTGNTLVKLTNGFASLVDKLKPSARTVDDLRRTFDGVFSLLHIGVAVVKDVIGFIGRLIGSVSQSSGGFLDFTGNLGDFLRHLDQILVKGGALHRFFDGLYDALKGPLKFLGDAAKAIGSLFHGASGSAAKNVSFGMHSVTDAAEPLHKALQRLRDDWDAFEKVLGRFKDRAAPVLDQVSGAFSKVGEAISNAFSDQNFSQTMGAIQTAFMGGIFLALRKALLGGVTSFGQVLASPIKNLNNVLGGLTSHLKSMQENVKAKTLLEIAGAIGILAAGVFVLSTVKPARLTAALTAMAVGLGELMAAMKIMTGGTFGDTKSFTMATIAASLVVLSTAVVILAGALKKFGSMSWKEIARGLSAMSGVLTIVAGAVKLIPPTFMAQSAAILVFATALAALGVAAKIFASMSWVQIGKGMAGMLGSLTAIAAVVDSFGPQLLVAGPGLMAVAAAMIAISVAVRSFGSMKLKDLAKGIGAMGVTIYGLAAVIETFPPELALQAVAMAASLGLVAGAMIGVAAAVKAFGSMSLETLAKGFVAIGAAIYGLAIGLDIMPEALPGAAALLVAASALAILGPAIGFIGSLKITTILKGLLGIAAAITVLAVAGTFAGPGLIMLGLALEPLAIDFAIAASGVFLLAKGLEALGGAGSKGVGVMIVAITGLIAMIPKIIVGFVQGVVETFDMLSKIAPKVINALDRMLTEVIAFITREAPKFAVAFGALILMLQTAVVENAPRIIDTGIFLIETLLTGIGKHIGKIVDSAATVIRRFINGITRNLPGLVGAGARMIQTFLNSVSRHIGGIANSGARVIISFLKGVEGLFARVVSTAATLAGKFVRGVAHQLVRLADVGAQAIIDFLNGMADVINKRAPQIRHAGWRLVEAIVNGMLGGFADLWHKVVQKAKDLADHLPWAVRQALKILSPSKVFHEIGANIGLGLANGIDASGIHAENSAVHVGDRVTKAMKKSVGHIPMALGDMKEFKPKITPILDLSHVRKHAGELGALTSSSTITPVTSNDHAMTILRQLSAAERAKAETELGPAPKKQASTVHMVQNNYSPKSLSTAEIYRRTGNQISRIRNELGLTHGGPAVVMQ